MDFWIASSHVLCPCCWALSSAVVLKGTFISFHPFRCNCSSQVIFVVQLGLHMGFLPVFVLFVTFFCCPLTTAMTSTLPMAEFFHCSVPCESKPGEVTVSKGLCSVGVCSHQWVMLTCLTLIQLSRFPSCCWPRQELYVFLWSDIAQVCLLAKEPCVCGTAASSAFPQSCSFRTFIHLFMWKHAAGVAERETFV